MVYKVATFIEETPFYRLDRLSDRLGIDLFIKRDDLLPIPGGGNKVRKVLKIISSPDFGNSNAIITNGGVQSNHARVTALIAAHYGLRCGLVLHGNPKDAAPEGNYLLDLLAGSEITIVEPERISSTIDEINRRFIDEGYKPFIIPGGGHCVDGALAYMEAVAELAEQCSVDAWVPECIVVASGTGTTQAGIVAGVENACWNSTKVIGVSVARRNPRGADIVKEIYNELCAFLHRTPLMEKIDFRDDWVCGGYEKTDDKVMETIRLIGRTEGVVLDPTYSGKAFRALLELVDSKEIQKGERVLFWHTGGLLNLMSSEYRDRLVGV